MHMRAHAHMHTALVAPQAERVRGTADDMFVGAGSSRPQVSDSL